MVPDVVVAVSALGGRQWAKQLKDYIQDHVQAMTAVSLRDPATVTQGASDIDVVVVDDVVCLFDAVAISTAGYHNIRFIGLTDERAGGRGRDYLADLGVDLILDSTTAPAEIAAAIHTLVPAPTPGRAQTAERSARTAFAAGDLPPMTPVRTPARPGPGRRGPAYPLTVIQECCGGGGADELAIALSERFATRTMTLLIEADETGSSLVGRLGLGTDRCLPHALGLVGHGHGQHLFPDALSVLLDDGQPHQRLRFDVLAGAMIPGGPPPNNPVHFRSLLETATATYGETVVVVGPLMTAAPGEANDRFATGRTAVAAADRLIVVTTPTPIGMARLINWLSAARPIAPDTPAFAVFGYVPRSRFVRGALRREVETQTEGSPVRGFEATVLLPIEKRAIQAAWDGTKTPMGATRRAADALADHLGRYPAIAHPVLEPAINGHRPRRAAGAAR